MRQKIEFVFGLRVGQENRARKNRGSATGEFRCSDFGYAGSHPVIAGMAIIDQKAVVFQKMPRVLLGGIALA